MIDKQDKNIKNDVSLLENSNEQKLFLSYNKSSPQYSQSDLSVLSSETLSKLEGLGCVLKRIHTRMKNEGYNIIDGVIVQLDGHEKITKN